MNVRKETKKAFEKFGEQLTILSNKTKTKGVGLFDKLKLNKAGPLNNSIGAYYTEKFSLWLYNYQFLNSIDTVINSKNETFEVITGYYDDLIGCWRLVVQKKSFTTISNDVEIKN